MRNILRIAAVIVLLVTVGEWLWRGHNTGWTKNTVTTFGTDPVTGISYPQEERKFVPGLDFLAGGVIAGGVLAGASFLLKRQSRPV